MQSQHKKRFFTTEVEEGFMYLFNFGGGKYKTTNSCWTQLFNSEILQFSTFSLN